MNFHNSSMACYKYHFFIISVCVNLQNILHSQQITKVRLCTNGVQTLISNLLRSFSCVSVSENTKSTVKGVLALTNQWPYYTYIYIFEHNKLYMFKSFSCSVICPWGKSNSFVNVETIFQWNPYKKSAEANFHKIRLSRLLHVMHIH